MLRRGQHNKTIQEDYDKYGTESFSFEVLEVMNKDDLLGIAEMEQFYIQKYNSENDGYNRTKGGDGAIKFDKDTRKAIADKNRVRMTGSKMSEKNKKKLIEANKNRPRTKEEKEHLSDFFYGENSSLAILTEEKVKQIERLLINGEKREDITKLFGVSEGCIQNIQYGLRWKKTEVEGWREY